jgi:hypothetical protein
MKRFVLLLVALALFLPAIASAQVVYQVAPQSCPGGVCRPAVAATPAPAFVYHQPQWQPVVTPVVSRVVYPVVVQPRIVQPAPVYWQTCPGGNCRK